MRVNKWVYISLTVVTLLVLIPTLTLNVIAQEDTNSPNLNKVTYNENVSAGETLEIKFNATDDISGVDFIYAIITSPSGKQRFTETTSQKDSEGNYVLSFTIKENAEQGRWKVSSILIYDNAENVYHGDDNVHSYYFNVENSNSDTTAPKLNKVTYNENVSAGETLEIKFNATDDISGVDFIYAIITSPSGKQRFTETTSQKDSEGNYVLSFTINENAEQGRWKVSSILIYDNAENVYHGDDNVHSYYFNVENSNSDTTAPKLNKVTYNENVSAGETLEIKFNATDDISGVDFIYAIITSPSGKQRFTETTSQKDSEGNYVLSFNVHENAEQGRWKVSSILIYDNAENVYHGDDNVHSYYFDVSHPKTKSVLLSTTGNTLYRIGNKLNLQAVSQGSFDTEYRYFIRDEKNQLTNLSQYSTDSNLIWVPQKSGNYTIIVHAKSSLSPLGNYYYYEAKDEKNIYIKNPKISSVSTTVDNKSPQKVNKTININASTIGGEGVNYRFYVRNQEGKLTLLRDYGKNNTVSWTPDKPGTYRIITHAKEDGKEGDTYFYEARNELTFKVEPEPITKVITTVNAASPQMAGKTITLNASTVGGENPNYRFYVRDESGKLTELKSYGEESTASWKPDKPGTYKLITHAKKAGKVGSETYYEARNEITYKIEPKLISEVTTTVDAASPQTIGKTITLKASANKGDYPNYRFYVRDGSGKLTELKSYGRENSVTWTPDKPGTYRLITHAKEEGNSGHESYYEAKNEIVYEIKSDPISKVTTTTNLTSPQKKGTIITFTATAVGGIEPEFRFYLRNESGKLILLRDYSPENTVTWTPDLAGKYEVITHVKEASSRSSQFSYKQRNSFLYSVN